MQEGVYSNDGERIVFTTRGQEVPYIHRFVNVREPMISIHSGWYSWVGTIIDADSFDYHVYTPKIIRGDIKASKQADWVVNYTKMNLDLLKTKGSIMVDSKILNDALSFYKPHCSNPISEEHQILLYINSGVTREEIREGLMWYFKKDSIAHVAHRKTLWYRFLSYFRDMPGYKWVFRVFWVSFGASTLVSIFSTVVATPLALISFVGLVGLYTYDKLIGYWLQLWDHNRHVQKIFVSHLTMETNRPPLSWLVLDPEDNYCVQSAVNN